MYLLPENSYIDTFRLVPLNAIQTCQIGKEMVLFTQYGIVTKFSNIKNPWKKRRRMPDLFGPAWMKCLFIQYSNTQTIINPWKLIIYELMNGMGTRVSFLATKWRRDYLWYTSVARKENLGMDHGLDLALAHAIRNFWMM
jgi:hypothetical protein